MTASKLTGATASQTPSADISNTPGHLIRRSHQIAVAMFLDEFQHTGLTPVQFAALSTIAARPGLDQSTLVNLIAVDRSTIGTILRGLEMRGLIRRITPHFNQRVKQLFIQPSGEDLLRATPNALRRSQERILAPLKPSERETFMNLLVRIVDSNNEFSRAPIRTPRIDGADAA